MIKQRWIDQRNAFDEHDLSNAFFIKISRILSCDFFADRTDNFPNHFVLQDPTRICNLNEVNPKV